MKPAATPEALEQALARELARLDGWQDPEALWTDNLGVIARGGEGSPVYLDYVEDAGKLIAGPLAPVLADLQRVTAERDEAQERVAKLEADVRAAVVEVSNQARARGEAEGALRASELAGIVDGWRERAGTAEAALATATAEAASAEAEVEAVLDEFEPRISRDRLLPSESIAGRVRHIAYEAVDGRAGEAGLLKTVERYEAANLALQAEVEALKGALTTIKTWIDTDLPAGTSQAGTMHRVVTKALDRTALARAATAGEGAQR